MRALLLSVVTLMGCRPVVAQCQYETITILGEVPLNCAAVRQSFDLLKRLHEGEPPRSAMNLDEGTGYTFTTPWPVERPTLERFDRAFAGWVITVEAEDLPTCTTGDCHTRQMTAVGSATQSAIGHQSLHFLKCRAGNCEGDDHFGWDAEGWTNFGSAFQYGNRGVNWTVVNGL